jgi:arginyl-tRNA synthetase
VIEDEALIRASLSSRAKATLGVGLGLLGVAPPEEM